LKVLGDAALDTESLTTVKKCTIIT